MIVYNNDLTLNIIKRSIDALKAHVKKKGRIEADNDYRYSVQIVIVSGKNRTIFLLVQDNPIFVNVNPCR